MFLVRIIGIDRTARIACFAAGIVRRTAAAIALAALFTLIGGTASRADGSLTIYFVDTEGGAATLIVSPAGESTLIDCGNPGDRDAGRIARAAKNAGIAQIDNLVITHWHNDHYGGAAALAKLLPIKRCFDRGIPTELADDPNYPTLIAAYKAVSHGQSKQLNPGDLLPLTPGKGTELQVRCLCARGETVPDRPGAPKNGFANVTGPMPEDTSDNARSLGFLLTYGGFRLLDLGDLTWNIEHKLVAPTDKIGLVDVYLSTHHGLDISNNPAVIKTVRPTVAIFNNGPHKGGATALTTTLRETSSVQAVYQLHRNLDVKTEMNAPDAYIANSADTPECKGEFIKIVVATNGSSFAVQVGPSGTLTRYQTRLSP